MTSRSLICLMLVVFSCAALGKEVEEKKNSLHKGAWAVQFGVYGSLLDFRLTDFSGRTFSGKVHFSPTRALRFGLDLSGSASDMQSLDWNFSDLQSKRSDFDGASYDHRIRGILQYLLYMRENNGFHLFAGLGPVVELDHEKNDELRDEEYFGTNGSHKIINVGEKDDGLYAGLAGSIGVEYFLARSLSLSAEFGSDVGYRIQRRETTYEVTNLNDDNSASQKNSDERTTTTFSYGSASVKLGLSIYF